MDIGRRIYYGTYGVVVLDTGERSGDVIRTTKSQDFAAYLQLQGLNAKSIDFIELAYGERSAEFANLGSMRVDPITKALTIYPRLTLTADKLEIPADGVAVATIVVSGVTDPAVVFSVNDQEQLPATPVVNQSATFEFATNALGTFVITAKSITHGQDAVQIQGV